MLSRTFGRGTRAPGPHPASRTASHYLPSFAAPFDWRRALSLHRRLLSGELSVLREVSANESDTTPSLVVLLVGVLAAGLGAWLWMVLDTGVIGHSAIRVLLLGSIASLAGWGLWLAVSWHALKAVFQISVGWRDLVRPFALVGGFMVWQFFMIAGPASFAVGLIVTIASVLLTVIAVRAAVPKADDRAAVISVGIGFSVYALVLSLLADLAGVGSGLFVHAIG